MGELFCTWPCWVCYNVYQCSAVFLFFPISLATGKVQEPVLRIKDKVNPTTFSFACYLYASF